MSNASSTLLLRQSSIDQGNHDELDSRPQSIQAASIRATSSPNEDDINVHRRYDLKVFTKSEILLQAS